MKFLHKTSANGIQVGAVAGMILFVLSWLAASTWGVWPGAFVFGLGLLAWLGGDPRVLEN